MRHELSSPIEAQAPRPRTLESVPMSSSRRRVEQHLNLVPQGFLFCGAMTCDIEVYKRFVESCRRARVRPPSLYAYFARCLGEVLEPQRELIAGKWRHEFLVPSRVDIKMAVEILADDGLPSPSFFIVQDIGNRALPDLADEVRTRLRQAKRGGAPETVEIGRLFAPLWTPRWWRNSVKSVRVLSRKERRNRAAQAAYVQLSSTSQWMQGRIAWGLQTFQMAAISITLGGMSRRAVVVGDEIVARWCVDVAFHFDHLVTDGAPATRFMAQLADEIESGRLLNEYDLPHTSSTRSSQLLDKSHSEYEESNENFDDAARYNESRA